MIAKIGRSFLTLAFLTLAFLTLAFLTLAFLTLANLIAMPLAATPALAQAQDKKITIVATTSMIADAVHRIGGSRVQVTALMGPGVDPHTYRQTRSDIAAMTRADAVFYHGLFLEAQLEALLRDLAKRKRVVALAQSLPKEQLLANPLYPDRKDPHVWMDPRLWKGIVTAARDALIALDEEGKAPFTANAENYLAEIGALADYCDKVLASVPPSLRVLVTAHDAFSYFGKAYGYEVQGIQGLSTESEAGLKRIEELVALLVQKKIRAIFIESSVSDRNVKALIEGAAAKGHTVIVGGELFSDAMGATGSYEGTYIGMIDHNAATIARALGGKVPEKGLAEKSLKNRP